MSKAHNRWLVFAQQDLQMAELAYQEGIYNQVCFHSQQCIEKCLKGILANQGKIPPRTHSIVDLLSLFPQDFLFELKSRLSQMDIFYIPTRYPDVLPGSLDESLPGKEEAEEAITLARLCWQVVIS